MDRQFIEEIKEYLRDNPDARSIPSPDPSATAGRGQHRPNSCSSRKTNLVTPGRSAVQGIACALSPTPRLRIGLVMACQTVAKQTKSLASLRPAN